MPPFNFSARLGYLELSIKWRYDEATGTDPKIAKVSAQNSETTDTPDTLKNTNSTNNSETMSEESITDTAIAISAEDFSKLKALAKRVPKMPGPKLGNPLPDAKKLPQDACPLFKTIPAEIKHMIYRNILVTVEPLTRAHELTCETSTILISSYTRVGDIDARVLRTCRKIYEEGMPILYGDNTFAFSTAYAVRAFREEALHPLYCIGRLTATQRGLKATANGGSSEIGENPLADLALYQGQFLAFTPFGRLTLLRFVKLELGSRMWDPRTNLRQVAPRPPDREGIWQEWSQSLFQRAAHPMFVNGSEGAEKCVFPALQHLTLDFSVWQLGKEEGLFVRPFIEKLRPAQGLKRLTIKGLGHQPTLDNFRLALVSEGGRFEVVG